MLLKKRLDHKVPFPEPMRKGRDFRPLFASVTILLLLGFVGVLNHIQQLTVTGGAVQTIGFVKGGSEVAFEVNTNGIKSATIHLTEDTKNARIFFTDTKTVSQKPQGEIYSMTSISSEKSIHFSTMSLTLRIKEEELLHKGIAVNDLQLYINGNPLKTTYTQKEGDYVFYKATTTELGDFVIGEKAPEETTVTTETTTHPIDKQTAPNTVVTEEKAVDQSEALVGKAGEVPPKMENSSVKESFWQKTSNFFKNLFS